MADNKFFGPLPKSKFDFDTLKKWLRTQTISVQQLLSGVINVGVEIVLQIGATFKTAESGQRISFNESDSQVMELYTGDEDELEFGAVYAVPGVAGDLGTATLSIRGPALTENGSVIQPKLTLASESRDATSTAATFYVGIGGVTPNISPPLFRMTNDFILMLEDGSTSRPSVTFNNAPSTGLRRVPASQNMYVVVNGGDIATFSANGMRGIDEEADFDTGTAAAYTNTAFADLDALTGTALGSAVAVTVDIGATGRALVMVSGVMGQITSGIGILAPRVSGASTVAASDVRACWKELGERTSVSNIIVFTDLTAGSTTFELQARVTSGTGSLVHPRLTVIPL